MTCPAMSELTLTGKRARVQQFLLFAIAISAAATFVGYWFVPHPPIVGTHIHCYGTFHPWFISAMAIVAVAPVIAWRLHRGNLRLAWLAGFALFALCVIAPVSCRSGIREALALRDSCRFDRPFEGVGGVANPLLTLFSLLAVVADPLLFAAEKYRRKPPA